MAYVEDDKNLKAIGYERPIKYTMDRSLGGRLGPFRFIFNQGALRCSDAAEYNNRICAVPRDVQTTLARESPSFVYLNVGCWVDDSDGEGTKHRDFGLVCGPHVYLCEFVGGAVTVASRVPAVQEFFNGLAASNAGARVVRYCRASNPNPKSLSDSSVYLMLGDLHMPPATWFYSKMQIAISADPNMPSWLENCPAMLRQKNTLIRDYYGKAKNERRLGNVYEAHSPVWGTPDIFGEAWKDLTRFLNAVASLNEDVRKGLHFIHLGDLLELWVGRDYQLKPGADGKPIWTSDTSSDVVADWALEVIAQNAPVIESLRHLEEVGLAEVTYIGGNHDGYMMKSEVASQLGMAQRLPFHRTLHGDLLVEHGHRFDGSNYDEVDGQKWLSGPGITERLYYVPGLRKLEWMARAMSSGTNPREEDGYLLGATLLYLLDRFHEKRRPFAIYTIGHTHRAVLARFDVRAEYTSTAHEEATEGENRP